MRTRCRAVRWIGAMGVSHAGNRALELLSALGERDQAPLDMNAAARLKQKAFSLFVAAYEDARRAIDRAVHLGSQGNAPAPGAGAHAALALASTPCRGCFERS